MLMPPLSAALKGALGGQREMTAQLMCEWQLKRPDQYRQHLLKSFEEALAPICDQQSAALISTYNEIWV